MNNDTIHTAIDFLHEITHLQNRKRYFLSLSAAPTVALLLLYLLKNNIATQAHILALLIPFLHLFLLMQLMKFILQSQFTAEHLTRFLMAQKPSDEYNTIIVALFVTDHNNSLPLKTHVRYTTELTVLLIPLLLTPVTYLTLLNPSPSSLEVNMMLSLTLTTILCILVLFYRMDRYKSSVPVDIAQKLSR